MNRTGKIARLPHEVREELNRRLRDNVAGPKICSWVNRLPAAKAVCAEFARRNGKEESPINENQLSEWRRGGFQDWLREQRMLDDTREMARWAVQLARESGGDLSEGAAVLLSGQLLKVLQGMAGMAGSASGQGSAGGEPAGTGANPMRDPVESCAPDRAEAGPHPGPLPSDGRGGSCSSAETKSAGSYPRTSLRVADTRSGEGISEPQEGDGSSCCGWSSAQPRSGGREGVESTVRMLGVLGKCLAGIRRGDQNRVRLAQVDRKLAQRDEIIALERRKYDDERAEIMARKKAEEKKKKAERKKHRRLAGLSDCGHIDWTRGRLFGAERVIKEKEAEIKESQKDLAILKREFGASEEWSDGDGTKNGGSKMEDGGLRAGAGSVSHGAPGAVAPVKFQEIPVIPSTSEELQRKNGDGGEAGPGFSPQRRRDAEGQGAGMKN